MTDNQSCVLQHLAGDVLVLHLHRPERSNAWGDDMADELRSALDLAERSSEVRACLITGTGKSFSSGADIGSAATHSTTIADGAGALEFGGHPIFQRLIDFPKPVICGVNGYAIGAGFLLVLCSDLAIADDNATFSLPQVRMGVIPAYRGLARLAEWVGRGRALEIGLSGRRVAAPEALSIGLVSAVVPPEDLYASALERAQAFAALPPLSYKLAKLSVSMSFEAGNAHAVGMADLLSQLVLHQTDDKAEAHAAWREKRDPTFHGR